MTTRRRCNCREALGALPRVREGKLTPSAKHIHPRRGLSALGRIYTLVYRARGAPIVGCGLLALRDAAAALRGGSLQLGGARGALPLARGAFNKDPSDGFDRVLAFGALADGARAAPTSCTRDSTSAKTAKPCSTASMPTVAGGQRGDFNHRFAQPSAAGVPGPWPAVSPSPASAKPTPSTARRTASTSVWKHMPKVMLTNTSWEYWRGDAALTHVLPRRPARPREPPRRTQLPVRRNPAPRTAPCRAPTRLRSAASGPAIRSTWSITRPPGARGAGEP